MTCAIGTKHLEMENSVQDNPSLFCSLLLGEFRTCSLEIVYLGIPNNYYTYHSYSISNFRFFGGLIELERLRSLVAKIFYKKKMKVTKKK